MVLNQKQMKSSGLAVWSVAFLGVISMAGGAYADGNRHSENKVGPNATVTFEKKTATLTADSKAKLDELVKNSKAHGEIDEVQVAAWSDNPAPRGKEELSRDDRILADKRARAVRTYLKNTAKVDVSVYNMAEGASWLARAFNTESAELKNEIGRGGDAVMSKEQFQVFKDNGQPSKAVLVVMMED